MNRRKVGNLPITPLSHSHRKPGSAGPRVGALGVVHGTLWCRDHLPSEVSPNLTEAPTRGAGRRCPAPEGAHRAGIARSQFLLQPETAQ